MSSVVNSIIGGVSGNTGGAGLNYEAGKANIVTPATQDQANEQYGQMERSIGQQQNFLNLVNAQGGLSNQANVFNQMQGVANGTGPNPAQAMLANSTGANVANQAAMMAGQRGSGANVGMMARQAAQQGASIQQNAAGQAAALQAQQSLGALNQMGGIATNQANMQSNATSALTNATQGGYSAVTSNINAQNQANVGSMSSQNSANSGVAGIGAKGQMDLIGGLVKGGGMAFAAEGGEVKKPGAWENLMHGFDAPKPKTGAVKPVVMPSQEDAQKMHNVMMGKAQGGMVRHYDNGGAVTPLQLTQGATTSPQSMLGKALTGTGEGLGGGTKQSEESQAFQGGQAAGQAMGSGIKSLFSSSGGGPMAGDMDAGELSAMPMMMAAKGGKVPAMVSPGEQYIPPKDIEKVKKGANPLKVGERIPGEPKYKGNNYANDVVPKSLDEGGVVIPNSIMQHKDAEKKAAAFVAAVLKKQSLKKGK